MAKKFIFQDKVDAIIGPTRTDVGMNAKATIEEAGVPTVMTVGSDPVIMGGKFGPYTYIFKAPQRATTAVRTMFEFLKEKKLTKVALLTGSDAFGKDGLMSMEQIAPEFGITFTGKESFGPKDTDMTAQLTNLKNTAPGHRVLDHRAGRVHCVEEPHPIRHQAPALPVPRPAGTGSISNWRARPPRATACRPRS